MTDTDVVSLLEGDYEQGLGALVNSLVRTGFTGTVWAGHRGPAPGWAASHRGWRRGSRSCSCRSTPTAT